MHIGEIARECFRGVVREVPRPRSIVKLERNYVSAGAEFGDAVSYLYMGECVGFEDLLDNWDTWENRYADLGYRTVSLDDFVRLGGYGSTIDHLLGHKRASGEPARHHARIYRQTFLGAREGNMPLFRGEELVVATYALPSTQQFKDI